MTPTKSCMSLVEKLIKFTILTVICKAEESRVKECSSPLGLGKICLTEIPEFSENGNFNKMSLYGHFKIYPTISKVAFILDFGLTFTKSPCLVLFR